MGCCHPVRRLGVLEYVEKVMFALFLSLVVIDPAAAIVGQEKSQRYVTLMPQLEHGMPDHFVWYDEQSIPPRILVNGRVQSANIDFDGNGNTQEPWNTPFGMHNVDPDRVRKFNFVSGKMVLIKRRVVYSKGTVVGEVLCLIDPTGVVRPFEVRTRLRHPDGWEGTRYRPVADRYELVKLVGHDWESDYQNHRLTDTDGSLEIEGATETLPKFDDKIVTRLLSRRFTEAPTWFASAHGPTTEEDYHIVPKGFLGGAFSVETCTQCHGDAGKKRFIRGSDGIFSINALGDNEEKLRNAGLLETYDEVRHSVRDYPGLKEYLE